MCVPLTEERAEKLKLAFMTEHNTDNHGTAFTVSVDAAEGTTTGISTGDRLKTIKDLVDPSKRRKILEDLGICSHLLQKKAELLERKGHIRSSC